METPTELRLHERFKSKKNRILQKPSLEWKPLELSLKKWLKNIFFPKYLDEKNCACYLWMRRTGKKETIMPPLTDTVVKEPEKFSCKTPLDPVPATTHTNLMSFPVLELEDIFQSREIGTDGSAGHRKFQEIFQTSQERKKICIWLHLKGFFLLIFQSSHTLENQ